IRQHVQEILGELRRASISLTSLLVARNFGDQTFDQYPSFGQLFYARYSELCRDGGNQIEKMQQAYEEFNDSIVQPIFEHYRLVSEWNESISGPQIHFIRNGLRDVPLQGLSLGEQEVLSLAASLHSSAKEYDVFLIDEPEVHLNWHLEERLFAFLD